MTPRGPSNVRRLLLATLLLALMAPASAQAATRHVIRGAGYGHGIGMSQYGAYGFAKQGRSYRQILSHYYRGTQLSQAATKTIRVLLQNARREVAFKGATTAGGRRLDPARIYRVRAAVSGLELRDSRGEPLERLDSPLTVTGEAGTVRLLGTALNRVKDGVYRGTLELHRTTFGSVTAVNAAPLDDYVVGVVPGEVPATWPDEALKAQAVAARSYALVADAGGLIFDQYPDTRSQVYRGVGSEHPRTSAAVRATAGEVLRHQGRIISTFFFSTSGGRTENVENVFYGSPPRPYLVSVEDPFDGDSPKHRWRISLSQRQIQSRLAGVVKGRFRRIKVVRRGMSPRVVLADVVGTGGVTRVRGAQLRAKLGLYDTWAYFTSVRTRRASVASRAGGGLFGWLERPSSVRRLTGEFTPAPAGGRLLVERRAGPGRWRMVRRVRTAGGGAFDVRVGRPGLYRVRAGAVAGAPVRVP